jgi:Tim17/Tim22/Tim23/Pmp24 family
MNSRSDNDDAGTPLPDFRASNIQLQTIAPALGVPSLQTQHRHNNRPDYLEYDTNMNHGRGYVVTMFANSGLSYLIGIGAGGMYGIRHGFSVTPSQRFRVQLNSILNHAGRYGSRAGNTFGTIAILYSTYEWIFDRVRMNDNKYRVLLCLL